ncbi:glucosaminidase domain-containing protein [Phorcysia thermohydrogeniphila]|uniref:Bax protein n=1 Tax=Phorcysia thermohydrogeniphila TaxID=936138 RepID=A0A4R1GEX5_9BACT|nr:glucosaminidase domain-containing protein [Phorcysia thermohydrogeniphila]TCK05400.1 Bax protein [Phorcysia thermohydrogeniphila]
MKHRLWILIAGIPLLSFINSEGTLTCKKSEETAESSNTISEVCEIIHEESKTLFPSHVSLKHLKPEERKKKFVEIMLPLIVRANQEVLKEREFVVSVSNKKELTPEEKRKLEEILKKYKASTISELLRRVDAVPVSLILAQAAVESGWGTSRFFTEANNAFGMYAMKDKTKCIKAKDSNVCLKVYDNLYQSVKDYIYNINVSWAYEEFRKAREKGADVYTLVEALEKYSTLRDEYVRLVKNVIEKNGFTRFDDSKFVLAEETPCNR